ncbi:enoyl-CoA hydratase-related protein, partial [Burkholderia thailandensis]|uniref:enoyl-CoA hydratase-related protein n=1 Tax=Burkholderia thailandensis TaxID=57975 RepID=UPI00217CC3CA
MKTATETAQMDIQIENAGGVLTITLARPAKKNAITAAMYQTMADALAAAQDDKSVR